MKSSAPLKWHGGKSYLAEWIIGHMPEHTHYVEPFFGGGAVLFRKDPVGVSEVINDGNAELTNFWFVLQDDDYFEDFLRTVQATPFSEREFDDAMSWDSADPVERAVAFFIRYRQSRQGLGRDFATLSRRRTRRGMNEQASSWWSAVDGLADAHDRLKRVVILNRDACDVIRQQDGESTLFYLDPPYVHATRTATNAYAFEMDHPAHERLLETLTGVSGHFILSGYPSDLYSRFADRHGWRCVTRSIDNKSSCAKSKAMKTECLWMNFDSPAKSVGELDLQI